MTDIGRARVRSGLFWKWVAFALALGDAFYHHFGRMQSEWGRLPLLLVVWFVYNIFYGHHILRRFRCSCDPDPRTEFLAYGSLVLDLVLISWMVASHGGVNSAYVVLYPTAMIAFAAICHRRIRVFTAGLAALGAYTVASFVANGFSFLSEEVFWAYTLFGLSFLVTSRRFLEVVGEHERLLREKVELEASSQELAAVNEALHELSFKDALTGLYNHRFFYHRLSEEIRRAEVTGQPVALLMLDIDFFKEFNDTHGHVKGDMVLKSVADLMRRHCRETDIVCRYGGEEFAVILPGTGAETAGAVGERIRSAIAEHNFPGQETQPGGRITVSLGAAVFPTDAASGGDLVDRADQALYKAKHSGKNKVQLYFSLCNDEHAEPLGSELAMDADLRQTIQCLLAVINARDHYTYGHSERVAEYAAALASYIGQPPEVVRQVRYAGWVHDLGMIEVSSDVLLKQGPLNEREKAVIRRHTLFGVSLIEPLIEVEHLLPMVRHHHENWDGSGYPDGLAGEDIPLGARIIGVVESFDAMLQTRPYRPALSAEEAVAELRRGAGSKYDPKLVEAFITMLKEKSVDGLHCSVPWAFQSKKS